MRAGSARSKPAVQEPNSLGSILPPLTRAPASMAERGAALQNHNNEQRDRVQKELASLTKQLSQVNDSLSRKVEQNSSISIWTSLCLDH